MRWLASRRPGGGVIDTPRETSFWDRHFEVVDLLVCAGNGYAGNYGLDTFATVTA